MIGLALNAIHRDATNSAPDHRFAMNEAFDRRFPPSV